MSDYIKREEITKYLFAREKILYDAREVERQDEVFRVLQEVLKLHAADVRENRNGQWKTDRDGFYFFCSECGKMGDLAGNWNYCPNCGASMQTKQKGSD